VDRINNYTAGANLIGIGEGGFVRGKRIATLALGSCVAVILYDPEENLGGIVHAMLPCPKGMVSSPMKYVDMGVCTLIDEMILSGADQKRLVAALIGGGTIFNFGGELAIGKKNVEAAKSVLRLKCIPIVVEETGGRRGRSVVFDASSGEAFVAVSNPPLLVGYELLGEVKGSTR